MVKEKVCEDDVVGGQGGEDVENVGLAHFNMPVQLLKRFSGFSSQQGIFIDKGHFNATPAQSPGDIEQKGSVTRSEFDNTLWRFVPERIGQGIGRKAGMPHDTIEASQIATRMNGARIGWP